MSSMFGFLQGMFDGEGDAQAQKLGVNSQKAENFEKKKIQNFPLQTRALKCKKKC